MQKNDDKLLSLIHVVYYPQGCGNEQKGESKYNILDEGDIEAKMKWVIDGQTPTQRRAMLYFPSVKLSVDGDIPFPKTDWQQIVINCEVLEDEAEGYGWWSEY